MSKHRVASLLLIVVALLTAGAAAEPVSGESLEDPKTEARAFEIAQRTMSPFCPGRTLADCPSGKATEWRQDIRKMLEEGKSAAEIQQILNRRAGTNLTGAPESSLGWALPVGLCVGALAVLTVVFRRIRREDAAEERQEKDADSAAREERELEERLRRELADDDNL